MKVNRTNKNKNKRERQSLRRVRFAVRVADPATARASTVLPLSLSSLCLSISAVM